MTSVFNSSWAISLSEKATVEIDFQLKQRFALLGFYHFLCLSKEACQILQRLREGRPVKCYFVGFV